MIKIEDPVLKDIEITNEHRNNFRKNGFVQFQNVFETDLITDIRNKVEPVFNGKFPTGIFPDEWNYRPHLSKPDITREIVNIWKCDPFFARIALSERIGKMVSELMGWNGARLLQDELFWKPAQAGTVGYHQDGPYGDFTPFEQVAVWVPLGDVSIENGTLEYAVGSHKWNSNSGIIENFHGPTRHKIRMEEAAKIEGIDNPEIHHVTLNKGGISLHHGFTWHGSSKNESMVKERVAYAFHFIPADCVFSKERPAYIYGRYKIIGSNKLEESFFPISYTNDGRRSKCCDFFSVL